MSTGQTEPVKKENNPEITSNNISFARSFIQVPSTGHFYLSGRSLFHYPGKNNRKILSVYDDGAAILRRYKGKAFQATSPETYTRIGMTTADNQKLPINRRLYQAYASKASKHEAW